MDGASFDIFVSDLEKAYSGHSLGVPPRQYPDISLLQRQALEKGDMRDELSYWQGIFPAGEQPPVLPLLPMARTSSRVIMKGFESHQVGSHLEPSLVARVKSVSKAQQSTPFHLHLAAFKAMLFCFAGEDTKDLTIGIADAARNDSDVKDSIGFFLNLLTLRFRRQLLALKERLVRRDCTILLLENTLMLLRFRSRMRTTCVTSEASSPY